MKRILFISAFSAYDKVKHAAGKSAHNIINTLMSKYNVSLDIVMSANEEELEEIKKCYEKINVFSSKKDSRLDFVIPRKDMGLMHKNTKKDMIKKLSKYEDNYDIVWLHWTESSSLYYWLIKKFKKSIFLLFEEDVKFLNFKRRYENEKNFLIKLFRKHIYVKERKYELTVCKNIDTLVCINGKDYNLLRDNFIDPSKIFIVPPYANGYTIRNQGLEKNHVLFYGAMNRKENEHAVLWFLENVFPFLDENIILDIVGNGPSKAVESYRNERINITGFVEDPEPYFNDAFCMICPLFLGAGIKVKTLQAFMSKIPLVSTDVGIEGIDAKNGEDFILANNEKEFIDGIDFLYKNQEIGRKMAMAGYDYILKNYDFSGQFDKLMTFLKIGKK